MVRVTFSRVYLSCEPQPQVHQRHFPTPVHCHGSWHTYGQCSSEKCALFCFLYVSQERKGRMEQTKVCSGPGVGFLWPGGRGLSQITTVLEYSRHTRRLTKPFPPPDGLPRMEKVAAGLWKPLHPMGELQWARARWLSLFLLLLQ